MILENIAISGLRNINLLELSAHSSLNWVTGPNGAGKTSLLEAIYLISRGRGYRGRKHGPLLGTGRELLEVSVLLRSPEEDAPSRLKLTQSPNALRFYENGQAVSGIHSLRRRFHVRLIVDNSQQLLEGQPGLRRLFLDWNLFHVEPGYGRILAEFRRVLGQRNAWLRNGARGQPVWDADYCRLAESLNAYRRCFLESLDRILHDPAVTEEFGVAPGIDYRSGWPGNNQLANFLQQSLKEDRERGFTFYGPPRADFSVYSHHRKSLPSRGQTKSLVFLLQFAAQRHWLSVGGPPCIWLLDDLGAELDPRAMSSILKAIASMPAQVFVTAVACLGTSPKGYAGGARFHVERGALIGMA